MSVINEKIKERRTALGLTLLDVASYLGVKEATAQRYESGAIKSIGHDTIIKLSEILKCSPSYLMGWEPLDKLVENDNTNFICSEFEKELVVEYRKADDIDKEMVCRVLKISEKKNTSKRA